MEMIEKYLKFIAKDLSPDEEANIFVNLSSDENLRNGLRNFIAFEKMSGKVTNSKLPPPLMTKGIYNKIGLVPPLAVAAGVTSNAIKSTPFAAFFKGRLFTGIVSGIASFAAASLLFLNTNVADNKNENLASVKSDSNPSQNSEKIASISNTPIIDLINKNKSKSLKLYAQNRNKKHLNGIKAVSEKELNVESPITINDNLSLTSDFRQSDILTNDRGEGKIPEATNKLTAIPETLFDTIYIIRSYDTKYRFEFKNAPSWSFANEIVQTGTISKYNNLELSLLFPIAKALNLGFEFRQETFHLQYRTVIANGETASIMQNPNLSTFSVISRLSPLNITTSIKPFAQIALGGNSYGAMTREMMGIEFNLFENLYMVGGVELSQFFFNHKSDWYNSNKYSLIYGLGVKF